jgi:hypothetical protein
VQVGADADLVVFDAARVTIPDVVPPRRRHIGSREQDREHAGAPLDVHSAPNYRVVES